MHQTSPTFGRRSSAEPTLDCRLADPHCTIEAPSGAYGWATACQVDEWLETSGTYQLESSYSRFLKNFLPALSKPCCQRLQDHGVVISTSIEFRLEVGLKIVL